MRKPAIGYSINGQESLFACQSRHSVVVYFRCCLCNIDENDFFASAKKVLPFFAYLRFTDVAFTLPHKKAFCAVQSPSSLKPPKTFSHHSCSTPSKHFSGHQQLPKYAFLASLWYCFIFLTAVTKTFLFVFLPLFRILFSLTGIVAQKLLDSVCHFADSTWYCICLSQWANGQQYKG